MRRKHFVAPQRTAQAEDFEKQKDLEQTTDNQQLTTQ